MSQVYTIPKQGGDANAVALAAHLLAAGVGVELVDQDAGHWFVTAGSDPTAAVASYVPPAPQPKTRDVVQAALHGNDLKGALTALLAAVRLKDD